MININDIEIPDLPETIEAKHEKVLIHKQTNWSVCGDILPHKFFHVNSKKEADSFLANSALSIRFALDLIISVIRRFSDDNPFYLLS